jgi:hypothetical protein
MKKPNTLTQFIEELNGEGIVSAVETTKDSKLIIYPNEQAADDEDGIELNREETILVLANPSIIERLYEALGNPSDASVVLVEISMSASSLDALEKTFVAVDEG